MRGRAQEEKARQFQNVGILNDVKRAELAQTAGEISAAEDITRVIFRCVEQHRERTKTRAKTRFPCSAKETYCNTRQIIQRERNVRGEDSENPGEGEKGAPNHASALASACRIVRRDVIYATINERRDFA